MLVRDTQLLNTVSMIFQSSEMAVLSDFSVCVSSIFRPACDIRKCNVCHVQWFQFTVLSTREPPLMLAYCRMKIVVQVHLGSIQWQLTLSMGSRWQHRPAAAAVAAGLLRDKALRRSCYSRSFSLTFPDTKEGKNSANWNMILPNPDNFRQSWWKTCQVLCIPIN